MNAGGIEGIIHWLGGLLALSVLGYLGIRHLARHPATSGQVLRAYMGVVPFPGVLPGHQWDLSWTCLAWVDPPAIDAFAISPNRDAGGGSLLFFPGLMLLLWGRLELGKYYFVSTARGAQLFKDQPLITSGPYAYVRHPMYAGLILAGLGSLLIYFTWTAFFSAVLAPLVMFRARREEAALAEEFGEEWRTYCKRVPAIFPRITR